MKTLNSAEFFSLVWPENLLTNETLELRLIHRKDYTLRRKFFHSRSEIIKASVDYSRDYNVYFGVSTRFGEGGKKRDCYRTRCVWADLDGQKIEGKLPFDKFTFNFNNRVNRPDILVDSGGGLHAYWVLNTPVLVRNERWQEIEAVNRGLCQKFHGDIAAIDTSRILRVPDCMNFKYSPPRPVRAYALSS